MQALVIKGGGVTTPQGFKAGVAKAGIKSQDRYDLALVVSEEPAAGAAVFTTNNCGCPVQLSKNTWPKEVFSAVLWLTAAVPTPVPRKGLVDAFQWPRLQPG